MYDICTEYLEIIAGTNNHYANAYMEASKHIEASDDKSKKYIENFVTSIETLNKKVGNDTRLSSSKGNIKSFNGYENITSVIDFLNKNAAGVDGLKDIITIKNMLEKYQPQYTEAYEKHIRILTIEYETALYMVITGLSLIIATSIDVTSSNDKITIRKKSSSSHGVIIKTCKQFAKELSSNGHKSYIEGLIKSSTEAPVDTNIEESVYTEGVMGEVKATIGLIDNFFTHVQTALHSGKSILRTIKRSFFGIVPLIRCGLYIHYKKKADTILALEQQAEFLQQNINRLEKRTNIDPAQKEEIIKKQKAAIEAYNKKAEKLRAQLMETEKEASTEIAKEDPSMGKAEPSISSTSNDSGSTDDGDFVLEGVSIRDLYSNMD
jgi:hypothetical protein